MVFFPAVFTDFIVNKVKLENRLILRRIREAINSLRNQERKLLTPSLKYGFLIFISYAAY